MNQSEIEKKIRLLIVQVSIEKRHEEIEKVDDLIKQCASEIFESFSMPKELEKLYFPKGRLKNNYEPL